MSEAYCFASLLMPSTNDPIASLCSSVGLRPQRIDVLHRLDAPDTQADPGLPVFDWPAAPLLDHFVLQQVCAALADGKMELAVICQFGGDQAAAVLLGGPAAVGRYNLPPEARLQPLTPLSGESGLASRAAAAALGALPEDGRITHLAGDLTADVLPLLEAAQALDEKRGVLFQLQALLAARADWSLLASHTAGAGLITLLERM